MNFYLDENGIEKLRCPLCGKEGISRMSSHLYNSHPDMSKEKFLELYPNTKMVSDNLHEKQSKATKVQWEDSNYRNLMTANASLQISEQWKDPKFRRIQFEKNSSSMKERWKSSEFRERKSKEAGDTLRRLWENEDFRKKRIDAGSKVLLKLWEDDEWRQWKCLQQSKTMLEKLAVKKKKIEYINRHGSLIKMRSLFECRFASHLDTLNIDYEYESLPIKYEYKGKSHTYFPDFLIREQNLVIEVKPSCYLNNDLVLAKKLAVIEQGYNFEFVTENDLENLDNSKITSILRGSTTIESIV